MKTLSGIICLWVVLIDTQCLVECRLRFRINDKYDLWKTKAGSYPIKDGEDPGKPLFLTPYLKAGKIKKAQKLSRVKPDIGDMESYSGFFTVNENCGSNLFFWYFPAQEDSSTAPVVTWLQGGPGASSMYGLFEELGPFNIFPDGLKKRQYSWNVKNHLLFIDQPVGTGFSFTAKGCYASNETAVGKDMYSGIIQFFTLFPHLRMNRFFLAGESYAGHYIPAIGYTIYNNNPSAKLKINLSGMMIGDGWTDPREQMDYADYLYQTGFIDYKVSNEMKNFQDLFVKQVDNHQWNDSLNTQDIIMGLISSNANINLYNYLPQPKDRSDWSLFIQLASTRKAIHTGSLDFNDDSEVVYKYLAEDTSKSVKPWVEELLEHYPILFYVGQVDVICAYPMVINFIRSMSWSGQSQYLNASRRQWWEGEELAGYVKGEHHLYEVLVRDAGHMVPADQPLWAFQLVNYFTEMTPNKLFNRKTTSGSLSTWEEYHLDYEELHPKVIQM